VRARLDELDRLLRETPLRARTEIMKHLDGDLLIRPLSDAGDGAFEISGRVKNTSLLTEGQEAGCARLVAGARTGRPATTVSRVTIRGRSMTSAHNLTPKNGHRRNGHHARNCAAPWVG
jgi:hypothetical protein